MVLLNNMDNQVNKNIIKHIYSINKIDRSKKINQIPKLIWFTGLSGSGKSTLCNAVECKLFEMGFLTYSLDGDNTRSGLNSDLSFSSEDRIENIRRIAEVAKLMLDAGLIVCAAFISPFHAEREKIKSIVGNENFIEIYVSTPIEECEKRDVKGLYRKARKGIIPNFTGISSPYEKPNYPALEIDTSKLSLHDSCEKVFKLLKNKI